MLLKNQKFIGLVTEINEKFVDGNMECEVVIKEKNRSQVKIIVQNEELIEDLELNEIYKFEVNTYEYKTKMYKYYKHFCTNLNRSYEFDKESIEVYLKAKVKGLRQELIDKIYDVYGDDTIEKLYEDPLSILIIVEGKKTKKVEELISAFRKKANQYQVYNYLKKTGLDDKSINRVIKTELTVEEIKKDFYILSFDYGISFKLVDAIAMNYFKLNPVSDVRTILVMREIMNGELNKGNTAMTVLDAKFAVYNYILNNSIINEQLNTELISTINQLFDNNSLAGFTVSNGFVRYNFIAFAEYVISERVKMAFNNEFNFKQFPIKKDKYLVNEKHLNESQYKAVESIFDNGITVINGPAGTGKTTLVRSFINTLNGMNDEFREKFFIKDMFKRLNTIVDDVTYEVANHFWNRDFEYMELKEVVVKEVIRHFEDFEIQDIRVKSKIRGVLIISSIRQSYTMINIFKKYVEIEMEKYTKEYKKVKERIEEKKLLGKKLTKKDVLPEKPEFEFNKDFQQYADVKEAVEAELLLTVKIVAPTGKAVKRSTEVTGVIAETIHKFLGCVNLGRNKYAFKYNTRRKIKNVDFLIVEESSMVDTNLFFRLISALDETTRIILIGDYNQLESVSAGALLRDMIQSNTVPVFKLSQVYRQGDESLILYQARHLLEFAKFNFGVQQRNNSSICKFVDIPEKDLNGFIGALYKNLKDNNVDLNSQVKLMTPYSKEDNKHSVNRFNELLHNYINPSSPMVEEDTYSIKIDGKIHYKTFRIGDRVMNLKNRAVEGVYNGDEGIVVEINDERETKDGDIKIVPCIYVKYEGVKDVIRYTPSAMKDIQLSYAITVHKSQGSEYDYAFIIVSNETVKMLNTRLLYTAITRAKKAVYFIRVLDSKETKIKEENGSYFSPLLNDIQVSTERFTCLQPILRTACGLPAEQVIEFKEEENITVYQEEINKQMNIFDIEVKHSEEIEFIFDGMDNIIDSFEF